MTVHPCQIHSPHPSPRPGPLEESTCQVTKSFNQLRQDSPKWSSLCPHGSLCSFISFTSVPIVVEVGRWGSGKFLLLLCQVLEWNRYGRFWPFCILIYLRPPQVSLLSRSHTIGSYLYDLLKSLIINEGGELFLVFMCGRWWVERDICRVLLFLPIILSVLQIFPMYILKTFENQMQKDSQTFCLVLPLLLGTLFVWIEGREEDNSGREKVTT